MKVGIMSMQRVINYGSFLQAYSLKKNIEALGAKVEFVDYQVEKPLVYQDDKKQLMLINLIRKIYEKMVPPVKLNRELCQLFRLKGRSREIIASPVHAVLAVVYTFIAEENFEQRYASAVRAP